MSFCVNTHRRARNGECPCHGCEERYVGCHGKCERFSEWDRKHRENREARQKKFYMDGQADRRKKEAIIDYNRKKVKGIL